jgi:hypothetical protein
MSFDKSEERYHSYSHLRDAGTSWADIGYGDSISADAARCWFNRYKRTSLEMRPSLSVIIEAIQTVREEANPHRGSNLDDFLKEEGILEEVQAGAAAKVQLWTGHQYEEKKEGTTDWRELFEHADRTNYIRGKASSNNTLLSLDRGHVEVLHFICLGDLHFFSGGTNHKAIATLTDRILSNPQLGIVLLGDVLENAINMRSAAEVQGQSGSSAIQLKCLESWLNEIKERLLFSTHDNHSSERFEKAAGVDFYGWIMAKVCPFFDGIGVAKIQVGSQEYKVGATHKMRGRSMLNPTHGQQRFMRFDDQSLDVMLAGDSHQYGISHYADGDHQRLAVNCGTANTNSAYAKRYFSLYSMPVFPVVTLYGGLKEFNAFPSIISWEKAHGNK